MQKNKIPMLYQTRPNGAEPIPSWKRAVHSLRFSVPTSKPEAKVPLPGEDCLFRYTQWLSRTIADRFAQR